ncbi:heterogeneous nuclear ribonucleoprotein L-like, partial [Nothoprocta perdicaria]|uniref:heterogeneous nuclear ribonucleoprotein L-like n=1 Tax=Nothoprocta perdicaria TaxID=30464 RepID=UPI000E1B593D
MPKKRQALVEFEDILGACNAVNYAADNQIYIAGQPAFVNYSTSQKISRPGDSDDSRGVNNVLLFTILNPIYSITTDVLYTICNPCGPVQRIVIFRKNGVQAMVEFDSVQSAQRAKASLNGADIYSGCCTLKIEYAKPTRLNVFKNDQDTWDYTNPNLSGQGNGRRRRASSLPAPRAVGPLRRGGPHGGYHGHYHDEGYGPPPPPHYEGRRMGPPVGGHRRGPSRYGPQYGHPPPPPPPPEYGPHADSPVLMVYGLDQAKMNCDRVFNIFCLYGNVEKVKFMKSKPGAAMVEMADGYAVDRAITHLNNNFMFGQKLNVWWLHRPHKRNAFNVAAWREMVSCFQGIARDPDCRAVVLSAAGKLFTAGIDLVDVGELLGLQGEDTARKAWQLRQIIRDFQESFTVLEKCPKPVIVAVHGACIGAGVDLIAACDIRYCTQDAWFQVK